ncbi:hypothetical protein GEMRC1_010959 [Eukaryota sp. GEM-RC1]
MLRLTLFLLRIQELFLRLLGGYRGGTDILYVQESLIWNQGGFLGPSLTIAEKGGNIDSWDLKEVLDCASVVFEDDVHWIRDSEIRGGRNASLIFNSDLKVYEGGLFTLSPSSFPPFASNVHQTPDDLPVVYINHGITLVGSGESFEFSWKLQNRGNMSVPSGFELMLFKGGYDSGVSRLLSEPTSYVLYGAPFPYYYSSDSWCYYNQSIIRLFDSARVDYAGFVCFDNTEIGPFGTIVVLESATICDHSSLSIEGTELILEGNLTFCHLTLATDFIFNPGQSLIISCSLTLLSNTLSGSGSIIILPNAYLYIQSNSNNEDHQFLGHNTKIINQGIGEIQASITGGVGSEFGNHGYVILESGHWINDVVNCSSDISNFFNSNRTVVSSDGLLIFDWLFIQIDGELLIDKGGIYFSQYLSIFGVFETHSDTSFYAEKDVQFINANVMFQSPFFFPNANTTVSFIDNTTISWIDTEFVFDGVNVTYVFDSGTHASHWSSTLHFKGGLIEVLSVHESFSFGHFVQTGGILSINSSSNGVFVSDLIISNGTIVSNSPWTVSTVQVLGGTFTGTNVVTLISATIAAESPVNCDASIKTLSATFTSGLVSGSDSCVIDSDYFVVDTTSQVTLDGCSSTFKNNEDLLVMKGELIFQMNLVNRGSIIVESLLRFSYCQFSIDNTVSTTSSGSIIIDSPTTFTSQSLLIGNGTITFASDSIVQGIVDLTGCVEVNAGVDVFFYNATIIQMNLCSVKGNVSFGNSTITLLNIGDLNGGVVTFEDGTISTTIKVDKISSGELLFKGINGASTNINDDVSNQFNHDITVDYLEVDFVSSTGKVVLSSSVVNHVFVHEHYGVILIENNSTVNNIILTSKNESLLQVTSDSFCSFKVLMLYDLSQFIALNSTQVNFVDTIVELHGFTQPMFNSGSNVVVSCLKLSLYDNSTVVFKPNTYSNSSSGFCLLNLNDYSVFSASSKEIIVVDQLVQNDFSTIVGSDDILVDQIFNSDSFWTF